MEDMERKYDKKYEYHKFWPTLDVKVVLMWQEEDDRNTGSIHFKQKI